MSEPQTNTCECKAEEIVLLPCAGGSNYGQITNRVAVKLDEEGVGHIYCLAGIGARVDGMVDSARGAKRIVALDGCHVACAKKVIEHTGLTATGWICVTDEGIDKNHQFKSAPEEIGLIARCGRESAGKATRGYPMKDKTKTIFY